MAVSQVVAAVWQQPHPPAVGAGVGVRKRRGRGAGPSRRPTGWQVTWLPEVVGANVGCQLACWNDASGRQNVRDCLASLLPLSLQRHVQPQAGSVCGRSLLLTREPAWSLESVCLLHATVEAARCTVHQAGARKTRHWALLLEGYCNELGYMPEPDGGVNSKNSGRGTGSKP